MLTCPVMLIWGDRDLLAKPAGSRHLLCDFTVPV
jgi:pimeloyl-ACP methyl ester carboxylesterase